MFVHLDIRVTFAQAFLEPSAKTAPLLARLLPPDYSDRVLFASLQVLVVSPCFLPDHVRACSCDIRCRINRRKRRVWRRCVTLCAQAIRTTRVCAQLVFEDIEWRNVPVHLEDVGEYKQEILVQVCG
jgi:hypothetical protein